MLLGFCGRAKHGKSTACEGVRDYAQRRGHKAEVFEISALVLQHCINAGKIPRKTRAELTPDELLVLIEEGRAQRALRKTYWLDLLDEQVRKSNPQIALVANVRYSNEMKWVRARDGVVVKCTRLNDDGSIYIPPDRPPNDPSETWADNMIPDHYITVKNGHGGLVEQQAITIFEYLSALEV